MSFIFTIAAIIVQLLSYTAVNLINADIGRCIVSWILFLQLYDAHTYVYAENVNRWT